MSNVPSEVDALPVSRTAQAKGSVTSPYPLAPPRAPLLSDALLARIGERAAGYDRENRFFTEDLDDLQRAGFLHAAVPVSLGGLGFTLPELLREQVRLAYRAPATALALNMHQYWIGAALHLLRKGDTSAQWILEEAGAGKVFAAGHGEPGNDLGLAHSFVTATPLPRRKLSFQRPQGHDLACTGMGLARRAWPG